MRSNVVPLSPSSAPAGMITAAELAARVGVTPAEVMRRVRRGTLAVAERRGITCFFHEENAEREFRDAARPRRTASYTAEQAATTFTALARGKQPVDLVAELHLHPMHVVELVRAFADLSGVVVLDADGSRALRDVAGLGPWSSGAELAREVTALVDRYERIEEQAEDDRHAARAANAKHDTLAKEVEQLRAAFDKLEDVATDARDEAETRAGRIERLESQLATAHARIAELESRPPAPVAPQATR
jgi:hypothetical protein